MRRNVLLAAALSGAFAVTGCQCINDDNFSQIRDAGFPPTDAGPPPPVFPLKAGDTLVVPQFGGRVNECEGGGTQGDCDRNIKGTWVIQKVELNDVQRWEITADVIYEGLVDRIPASALTRLALENAADFAAVTAATPVSAVGAVFTTDVAPSLDSSFGPNNFPFFQGENDSNDGDDGTVFNEAATEFREAITALDPEAQVETQIAAGKLEAYFKDEVGGDPLLHKLLVEIHPMGFVCGWDERTVPFVDGIQRSEAAFTGIDNPPLVASFFQPNLTRDGVTYQCSCFSGTCRNSASDTCLDPTDPDAPPGPCP